MKILVVDDEAAMREVVTMRLESWGYDVCTAEDGAEGEEKARAANPDIVISDVVMPGASGLELLKILKAGNPSRPVVLVTAQATVDLAVEAMKRGAHDFITKPIDYAKLKLILEAAGRELQERRESRRLSLRLDKGGAGGGLGGFVGDSKAMREIYGLIGNIARSDASVIITGESGTGKELAARTIHDLSRRAQDPFVAVNSSAIPENLMENEIFGHERGSFTGALGVQPGCFELANHGTLFLDEIAEMPLALQPKLLRVLEDRKVRRLGGSREFSLDVRVLCATNLEPRAAVENGKLREDLFYRLNVFTLTLPPLRDRAGDIPLLVQAFIRRANSKHGTRVEACRAEALESLKAYAWPGNVRELGNVVERAVILSGGEWIDPSHLPAYVQGAPAGARGGAASDEGGVLVPDGLTAAEVEKELILRTLQATGNNKAETARRLGIDVKTVRNKLKGYGLA
ncbi:MAG: sigma-54 dependent transcriptional regulator [Acidobacteriota bacterium]|jgi:DNA-binding NtrC family response regulator|nr:sigma-54 dependent transcriptional regulator [Acidobacteriota bacterium]